MNLQDLVRRVDELLTLGERVVNTRYSTDNRYSVNFVQAAPMAEFRTAVLSFVDRVYGREHPHFEEFQKRAGKHFLTDAEEGISIVNAIRGEIAGGWLFSVKSLANAEVFADFMEMAEHLLDSGYKDSAAVMAGAVLEEHVRQLCRRRGVEIEDEKDGKPVPKKADRLNAELARMEAYSKLDQKLLTAWFDLRNNAAHGKYDAYSAEQVGQMIAGVLDFMGRNPS